MKVGLIRIIKDCEWKYKDDQGCPEVPIDDRLDWECDPRIEYCLAYHEDLKEPETTSTSETAQETNSTDEEQIMGGEVAKKFEKNCQ